MNEEYGGGETVEETTAAAVSQSDFDAFKSGTEAALSKTQAKLDAVEAAVSDSTHEYIFGGLGGILFVAVVICYFGVRNVTQRLSRLQEKLSAANDTIADLSRQIKVQESRLNELKIAQEKNRAAESSPVIPKTTVALKKNLPEPPQNLPLTKISLSERYAEFVREFNELAGLSSVDARKAADAFTQKYGVRSFSCVNAEERVNDPMPAPEFKSLAGGNYWAYEVEAGTFAVVPKVKLYNNNIHWQQAMGEVFDSNFEFGGAYKKIRVERPAIFKGEWTLERKGLLELE